jgi:transcriptional regulator GlxA family with amidase domain
MDSPMDSAMDPATEPLPRIAILAVPGASASVIHGMYDLFVGAGRDWLLATSGLPGPSLLEPCIVSIDGRPVAVANGLVVTPHRSATSERPDVVCVPEVYLPRDEPVQGRFDREIVWLRRCHEAGVTLATVCTGAVLLAEAGLLDGHEATTHWAFCDEMAQRYPRVTVRPHRSLVVSGEGHRLVMAGGGTSWLDLALFIVARLAGLDHAMQLARVSLIDWQEAGQQPFASLANRPRASDALIARSQRWLADHYREPAPVAAMAQVSGLALRSFSRRFQNATGMAPLAYVHTLRLEEAKQMLEASQGSIASIAEEVGYEDAGYFTRLFRRQVGISPAQYRRRFGGLRRSLGQSVTAGPLQK